MTAPAVEECELAVELECSEPARYVLVLEFDEGDVRVVTACPPCTASLRRHFHGTDTVTNVASILDTSRRR
jgi:hypothetical protein